MHPLHLKELEAFFNHHQPPCISVYLPTHRCSPDNALDPICYKNLLRTVEMSLQRKFPAREVRPYMERLQAIAADAPFWIHRLDGLAVLASADRFGVFELQQPVKELAVVADSFHLKPLLRYLQSADRYQVLCLDRQRARLFEGNRYVLDEVDLSGLPVTRDEALGKETAQRFVTFTTYGKGGQQTAMFHGQGGHKDEVKSENERFFRVVDRVILDQHSRAVGVPLVLAALPEHQGLFREVSANPNLVPTGIPKNPEALSVAQLREEAWTAVAPRVEERMNKMIEDYRIAHSRWMGEDSVAEVAKAAVAGRVGGLLLEADRILPGRLDRTTGEFKPAELIDPETDDVLDDLGELVLRSHGTVLVVPKERMPSTTGVAAIYRY